MTADSLREDQVADTKASDLGEPNPTAPGLSRLGLTLLLLLVITLPPLLVFSLWWILPQPEEARLSAEVVLTTLDDLPAVAVTNREDAAVTQLEVNLNGAFHHYASQPLASGDTMTLPLAAFVRKSGVRFDPDTSSLRSIGVYARLASGARGVLVLEGEEIAEIRRPDSRQASE